jgi:hypothetical protein
LRSLDWARRQGALSWELRTSTSLARLQPDQGRTAEARSLLQRVYDRFSEGFETAEAAKAHLNSLQCDVPGAGGAHFLGAVYSDRASNLVIYLGAKSTLRRPSCMTTSCACANPGCMACPSKQPHSVAKMELSFPPEDPSVAPFEVL